MSAALTDLVTSLLDDVPAVDAVPNYDQGRRYVIDAVADFSRRVGRVKAATLSIVADTGTYSLPDDFMRVVYMQPIRDVTVTGGYKSSSESWSVASGQITFEDDLGDPPAYTATRKYRYQASFYLDPSTETYADLGAEESEIILLYAAHKALMAQANQAARQAWQYSLADERVSKENLAAKIREQAEANRAEYLSRVKQYIGALISQYRHEGGNQDANQWRLDPDAI
jgi:hypothetical protein